MSPISQTPTQSEKIVSNIRKKYLEKKSLKVPVLDDDDELWP